MSENEHEPGGSYVFELSDGSRIVDRFTYDGPYDAGYELAEQRAAAGKGPVYIHVEVN